MSTDARFNARRMYDTWRVTIVMRDRLCGGKPKNQELLITHIKRMTGHDDETTKQQIAEATEKLPDLKGLEDIVDEKVEKSSTGFLSDDKGLYICNYQIKAMFKQSASMLGVYVKKRGSRQICAEGAEIKGIDHESKVYLLKSGDPVKEVDGTHMDAVDKVVYQKPDGSAEDVVHAMTPKGKISGIKYVDYVEKPMLRFEIWVLKTQPQETRHIGEKDLIEVLTFAQENGLGADRSRAFGKFDVVEFIKNKE